MTGTDDANPYTPQPLLPFHLIENKRYLYLALPANAIMPFWLATMGLDSEFLEGLPALLLILLPFMLVSMVVAMVKLGEAFSTPLFATTACSLPISLWENINQRNNGCLSFGFPGESRCPSDPPGYELPLTVMIFFQIGVMLLAVRSLQRENWKGMYGFLYAGYISVVVYLIAFVSGLWS